MRVVIGKNINSEKYIYYPKLKDIESLDKSNLEAVIFTSSDETDMMVGVELSNYINENDKTKLLYISEKPVALISCYINALGGLVSEDISLLDEEMLDYLIENYGDSTTSLSTSVVESVEIVEDFINQMIEEDTDNNINKIVVSRVTNAMQELKESSRKNEISLKNISASAIRLFTDVDNIMKRSIEIRERFAEFVKSHQEKSNSLSSRASSVQHSPVMYYPTIKYTGTKKIMHIKVIGECRYLLSLILAYQDYVSVKHNRSLKIILCFNQFKDLLTKFSSTCGSMVTPESVDHERSINSNFVVTPAPKEELIKKLISVNCDGVIIVDYMYGENIINGTTVDRYYALTGGSYINKFKLQPNRCILPIKEVDNVFMCIPHINNYPEDKHGRLQAYMATCSSIYSKLDNLFRW